MPYLYWATLSRLSYPCMGQSKFWGKNKTRHLASFLDPPSGRDCLYLSTSEWFPRTAASYLVLIHHSRSCSSISLIAQKHCSSRVSHPAPDVSSSGTFVKGGGAFYPVSTELNHCKARCWHSLTLTPLSRTNTTFASIPLLMPCRTWLSCIVLGMGIRGTELAGHLLCWQTQLPYLLWRACLPWSRHHVKPEWQPSMIQQRFCFWLLVFSLFAWQKMTSIIIWGPCPRWTALRFAISHKLSFQGMIMLSSPLAAGEEWYLIIRQMHKVLEELLPPPTDSFLSPNHLQRPKCRNGAGKEPPKFLHVAGEG